MHKTNIDLIKKKIKNIQTNKQMLPENYTIGDLKIYSYMLFEKNKEKNKKIMKK